MAQRGRDRISFREIQNADGSATLHARIPVPEKAEDGTIAWRRIERSTRTGDLRKAQKIAERIKDEEYKKFYSEKPKQKTILTFADAALSYLKADRDGLYLEPILREIGAMNLTDVNQSVLTKLAEKLYPGRKPATINRQIFTPVIAVLRFVPDEDYAPPRFTRPKGWLAKSNFKRPPKDWWRRVIPECAPNLAAVILFWRLHGRRTSEACRIKPEDVDGETWRVTVRDTKEEQDIVFKLARPVVDQLNKYPWRLNKYVFGYSSKSKVYPDLKAACARAGVPYHVPKDFGRHSMATHLLESGKTLAEVKEAGRWKSTKMPDLIYGHLEQSRVDDDVREMGEKWVDNFGEKGEVVRPIFGEYAGKVLK